MLIGRRSGTGAVDFWNVKERERFVNVAFGEVEEDWYESERLACFGEAIKDWHTWPILFGVISVRVLDFFAFDDALFCRGSSLM